jgi:cold shock CspA family protein
MLEGRISRITDSGYGYIASGSGDVFFTKSSLEWGTLGGLEEGQTVEYELFNGIGPLCFGYTGGPQACLVRPVGSPELA